MSDDASMASCDKGSWQKSHCNLNYVWTSSYSHQPLFYQIAKIERCGNCWSRNLNYKFCIGTLECSQTIRMNVHGLCRVRVHRDVWCTGYMKLACSTVFVCFNYSAKKWYTNFKIKMPQLIIQNYKLSLSLTLLGHNLLHIVLQVL